MVSASPLTASDETLRLLFDGVASRSPAASSGDRLRKVRGSEVAEASSCIDFRLGMAGGLGGVDGVASLRGSAAAK